MIEKFWEGYKTQELESKDLDTLSTDSINYKAECRNALKTCCINENQADLITAYKSKK